jgi:hypothetical protein
VPRFFFDFRADDGAMEPDDEGVVLESVEAACAEAARAAAAMLKDRAEIGTGPNSFTIVVRAAAGSLPLCTVNAALKVE